MANRYAYEPFEKMERDMPSLSRGVVVSLTIRLHSNGAMSVEGPVHDKDFCRRILEEALATINRQTREKDAIVTPARDVEVQSKELILP